MGFLNQYLGGGGQQAVNPYASNPYAALAAPMGGSSAMGAAPAFAQFVQSHPMGVVHNMPGAPPPSGGGPQPQPTGAQQIAQGGSLLQSMLKSAQGNQNNSGQGNQNNLMNSLFGGGNANGSNNLTPGINQGGANSIQDFGAQSPEQLGAGFHANPNDFTNSAEGLGGQTNAIGGRWSNLFGGGNQQPSITDQPFTNPSLANSAADFGGYSPPANNFGSGMADASGGFGSFGSGGMDFGGAW